MRSGKTIGSPVALVIRNLGRLTPPAAIRVACCTIARKFLEDCGIFIGSHVLSIGRVRVSDRSTIDALIQKYTRASCGAYKITEEADKSQLRFLDESVGAKAAEAARMRRRGEVLRGTLEVLITGAPAGLGARANSGERLGVLLIEALMSDSAVRAVEIESGFHGSASDGGMIALHVDVSPLTTGNRLAQFAWGGVREVETLDERRHPKDVQACSVLAEAVIAPVFANAFLDRFQGAMVKRPVAGRAM